MAVTADQVEVRLRADTAQYVRNINQADAAFSKTTNSIVANTARIQQSGNVAASSFAGVGSQFQDIAVTAAAGMNPLIIALQQGTQLSAQLQLNASRGEGVFRSLATGITGLINPISLATIATIALGTATVQWLGTLIPETRTANDILKAHLAELEDVVRGYDAAEEAVDAYGDSLGRLPQFAVNEGINRSFQELAETSEAFRQRLVGLEQYLNSSESNVGALGRQMGQLVSQFNSGEITAEEFYNGLNDVESQMGAVDRAVGALGGGIGALVGELQQGSIALIQFGDAAQRALAASFALAGAAQDIDLQNALDLRTYISDQERLNGLSADQLALERETARIIREAGEYGITEARARELAAENIAAAERRAAEAKALTAGGRADTSAERERQAVLDLIDTLEYERSLIGQSARDQAIANAARDAGSAATEQQIARIRELAGAIYDEQEAFDQLNMSAQQWADTVEQATRGFINDLIEGKSAAEAFSNVLSRIADQLIDAGLSSIFGTGGLNLTGLFGGTSTRATGGPVYAGNPTLVGERGPEVFVPSGPGRIVPNSQLSSGASITYAPVIDARGADAGTVARLEAQQRQLMAEFEPRVKSVVRNANKTWRAR